MKIGHLITLLVLTAECLAIDSNHSYFKNSNFMNDFYVDIKGIGNFNFSYIHEDKKNMALKNEREVVISFILSYEQDEIFSYGFDFVGAINNQFGNGTGGSVFLKGYYGKLEVGGMADATEKMRVGADSIAVGTGGSGGNSTRYISNNSVETVDFLIAPGTLMNQNFGYYDNTLKDRWGGKYTVKVNYFTPEFYGFQFGLSIKPNSTMDEDNLKIIDTDKINVGTFVSGAINYIDTLGDFGLAVSMTYEQNFANPLNKTDGNKEKVQAYFKSGEVGINLSYYGLTLAGSFGINNRNTTNITLEPITKKNGKYFTYGVAYEFGSVTVSATFFDGRNSNNRNFGSGAVAIKKNLNKNISIFLEGTAHRFKGGKGDVKKNNEGFGVFTGLSVRF